MPHWIRYIVMLGVFSLWSAYIILVFAHGELPPLPAWSVPPATFAILSGKHFTIGRDGVSVDQEDELEPKRKES